MAIYRRRLSPLKTTDILDYKDVELLSKFLTEQGKILPRRVTVQSLQNPRQHPAILYWLFYAPKWMKKSPSK